MSFLSLVREVSAALPGVDRRTVIAVLGALGRSPVGEPSSDVAALLRLAASGRREYAVGIPVDDRNPSLAQARVVLESEALTLEAAAKVVEGDLDPLLWWLPSWRWGEVPGLVEESAS